MKVFSLNAGRGLAERVARGLGLEPARHEEREFEDGEFKVRPLVSVRNERIFLCQSTYGDEERSAGDRLLRVLVFIGALKDAGAAEVVALVPYLAFARKDARSKPRDPVTTRYVAAMFEAVGADAVVCVDVHNQAAFENAFRCRKENLHAAPLFADHFASVLADAERTVVVSPDGGGVKRATRLAEELRVRMQRPVDLAFVEKHRSEGRVSGTGFAGDVRDAAAVIVDDMICGGSTIARAARACLERGARSVHAAATHGVFTGAAGNALATADLASVVITDTIGDARGRCPSLGSKLVVLEIAPLLRDVIERFARRVD